MIDASRIAPRLYQGGKPPAGPALAAAGVRVLVLCAKEHQPPAESFPGVRVIHAPNDDSGPPSSLDEMCGAVEAARLAAAWWRFGARVLVTCAMGLNRSGLVTALILKMLSGDSGRACVERVRSHRPGALSNRHFADFVERL